METTVNVIILQYQKTFTDYNELKYISSVVKIYFRKISRLSKQGLQGTHGWLKAT
jgi:hypothetical protein